MTEAASRISVIEVDAKGSDAVGQVLSLINAVSPALGDRIHTESESRPYATQRIADRLRIISFVDEITLALMTSPLACNAHLIERSSVEQLTALSIADRAAVEFLTPTHWKRGDRDHLLPDPESLFRGLMGAWHALEAWGWPPFGDVRLNANRIAAEIISSGRRPHPTNGGSPRLGFVGKVRYDMNGLRPEHRELAWRLLRFAEWRGAGRHTTYGMGRMRILSEGDHQS